jgi:hypothetical protein
MKIIDDLDDYANKMIDDCYVSDGEEVNLK